MSPDGLAAWMECFRVIQGAEIWASLGGVGRGSLPGARAGDPRADRLGLASNRPTRSGPGGTEGSRGGSAVACGPGDVLCLPTDSPRRTAEGRSRRGGGGGPPLPGDVAPLIAGLGGLPQVSLPLAAVDGCPVGLSIAGARGSDLMLLRLAARLLWRPGP